MMPEQQQVIEIFHTCRLRNFITVSADGLTLYGEDIYSHIDDQVWVSYVCSTGIERLSIYIKRCQPGPFY